METTAVFKFVPLNLWNLIDKRYTTVEITLDLYRTAGFTHSKCKSPVGTGIYKTQIVCGGLI